MTGGQKALTAIAILGGLLCIILGVAGANKAEEAGIYGSDADVATAVAIKAASGDSFMIMVMAIIGLCVAAAVREMLSTSTEVAGKPGAATTAAAMPAAAPPAVAEPSVAPDVQTSVLTDEPVNAEGFRPE